MIRRRVIVWAAVSVALVAATVASSLLHRLPVETDLLALLPQTERNPVVERAAAGWVAANSQRSVTLVGHPSASQAKQLALRYADVIASGDVFKDVRVKFPVPDATALHALYLPYRFQLLTPSARDVLAESAPGTFIDEQLRRRLFDPFRRSAGVPLAHDPMGLLDDYVATLPFAPPGAKLDIDQDGILSTQDDSATYVVVTAQLSGSAYDAGLQKKLQALTANADKAVRDLAPDARILRTGAVYYATAGRVAAEREFDVIGLGSLIGIVVMLWLTLRSLRPVALGLISVSVGVCAATLATVGAFGHIHIITLVFGASLTGEAIDYSIQYFAARLHAGNSWNADRGLRAVLPAIAIAVGTSVLGYAALALTPFPALRQIALFAVVGLIVAGITVALLLPAMLRAPTRYQPRALLGIANGVLRFCRRVCTPRVRAVLAVALVLACAPGWMKISPQDDIRLLVNPPPVLAADESAIRGLTGFAQGTQFFIVEGADVQELLQNETSLTARLRELTRRKELSGYQALSDFVPPTATQARNYALLSEHVFAPAAKWPQQAAAIGLRRDVAAQYAAEFRNAEGRVLTVEHWLASPASAPVRHLWLGTIDDRYVSMVLPTGIVSVEALAQAASGMSGVTLIDKAGHVSRLFHDYRRMSTFVLLIAALFVGVLLCLRYGLAQGLQALLPTASGIGVVLAWFGYGAMPLTLFSSMALLLVLGVSVNYVIFLREGAERDGATLIGVLLSAATTLLSFGLLAWSSTPALAQFGSTLFIGIAATVGLAPLLGPISARRNR